MPQIQTHSTCLRGTTAMTLTIEQFEQFCNTVTDLRELHQHAVFRNQKCVNIPTAAKGLVIVYSPNELELLRKMFEVVQRKLDVKCLLEMEKFLN